MKARAAAQALGLGDLAQALAQKTAARQALREGFLADATTAGVTPDFVPQGYAASVLEATHAAHYEEAFGVLPSVDHLAQVLGLNATGAQQLAAQFDVAQAASTTGGSATAALPCETDERLLTKVELLAQWGLTPSEYERWRRKGRLRVTEHRKRLVQGRAQLLPLHHPRDFEQLTPQAIAQWRAEDLAALPPKLRTQCLSDIALAPQQALLALELLRLADTRSVYLILPPEPDAPSAPKVLSRNNPLLSEEQAFKAASHAQRQDLLDFEKRVQLRVPLPQELCGQKEDAPWSLQLQLQTQVASPQGPAEVTHLATALDVAFDACTQQAVATRLGTAIADRLQPYAGLLRDKERVALQEALSRSLEQRLLRADHLASDISECFDTSDVRAVTSQVEQERAQALLALHDFPQSFPMARSMGRRAQLCMGPTNSGKTHAALEALKAAPSGMYLAPLRLLALELRDRLTEAGIACNLMTGEEQELVPGATHTAATIEMMDSQQAVDVAVIDEVQMLEDPNRGWAWTQALLGAPATQLYVCGSATMQPACERLFRSLGESVETRHFTRKVPLQLQPEPLKEARRELRKGDALIAFSRRAVLNWSAQLRRWGFKVATVYGALAPEVRRAEAERFASGQADILVATDAIGMGLNLPIERVVFSTVQKYDGEAMRSLRAMEVLQVAGRAGRFGLFDAGWVATLNPSDHTFVGNHLRQPAKTLLDRLAIAPNLSHVQTLAQVLRTENLVTLLTFFANSVSVTSPLFKTAELEDMLSIATQIEERAPELPLAEKLIFARAPVAPNKPAETSYLLRCLKWRLRNEAMDLPATPDWLAEPGAKYLEKAEDMTKHLSVYAWLSFKFPENFPPRAGLQSLRAGLSRYIEAALLQQSGGLRAYGQGSGQGSQASTRAPSAKPGRRNAANLPQARAQA